MSVDAPCAVRSKVRRSAPTRAPTRQHSALHRALECIACDQRLQCRGILTVRNGKPHVTVRQGVVVVGRLPVALFSKLKRVVAARGIGMILHEDCEHLVIRHVIDRLPQPDLGVDRIRLATRRIATVEHTASGDDGGSLGQDSVGRRLRSFSS